jgi:Cu+-exporting ATPase
MAEITHQLTITGMTCGGCSGRVVNVLEATPGVLHAAISHQTNSGVIVTTDTVSTEDLLAIVAATGFGVTA